MGASLSAENIIEVLLSILIRTWMFVEDSEKLRIVLRALEGLWFLPRVSYLDSLVALSPAPFGGIFLISGWYLVRRVKFVKSDAVPDSLR